MHATEVWKKRKRRKADSQVDSNKRQGASSKETSSSGSGRVAARAWCRAICCALLSNAKDGKLIKWKSRVQVGLFSSIAEEPERGKCRSLFSDSSNRTCPGASRWVG